MVDYKLKSKRTDINKEFFLRVHCTYLKYACSCAK